MAEQQVSVVIPCFNAAATLERCLAALASQKVPPLEVIVADNGSGDDTVSIVRRWMGDASLPLRLIEVEKRGAAAARNAAAGEAKGEWIAFTDSDCLPEPEWLANGIELLADSDPDVAALAGPAWGTLEGDGAARLLGLTSLSVGLDDHIRSDAGPTGSQGFAAANLWVNRQVLHQIEGFDESLTVAGEDFDLCARLFTAGFRLRYSPQLRVRHIHPSGVMNMCRKQVQYGWAHALLAERYGQPGIYLDLPLIGRRQLPSRYFVWCNLASAEKKVLLLSVLSCWQPWLLLLLPVYLYLTGRGLCRREKALGMTCGAFEAFGLSVLLVLKSVAMSWGRLRGSRRGVVAC